MEREASGIIELLIGWQFLCKQEMRSVELGVCPMQLFHF